MKCLYRERLLGILLFETSATFCCAAYDLWTRDERLAYMMGGEL